MTIKELLERYIGTECHIQYLPDKSIFVRIHMGYGRATPVEESYRHLWNQLDVFGKGDRFPLLNDPEAGEGKKRPPMGASTPKA